MAICKAEIMRLGRGPVPRANRHYLPGYVWHLTHRCHEGEFLLKFGRDRLAWIDWLYEARKRYGLCVLNYTATSNHGHVLTWDQGQGEIARSMQLIAGRTGQDYNRRKGWRGAFWEDRYHATAVESGAHLARCLVYIDLNMVRAGVVRHPAQWPAGGYHEIQAAPRRYWIVDRAALAQLLGLASVSQLPQVHAEWVETARRNSEPRRQPEWTESLAVGSRAFAERVRSELGERARDREVGPGDEAFVLREPATSYRASFAGENSQIRSE